MSKSKGQTLVEAIEVWLSGYMSFPDASYALVCALWAINTWVFDRFDATPYLAVTAATKGAGKTRLMELLRPLCQNGRMFGDMTGPTMFRLLEAYDSKVAIFFDEAEKLSAGTVGTIRTVMNTGYRRGQKIPRTMPGGKVMEFPVYSPKCFALIGDVYDTLRDRSIVLTLERGTPEREYFEGAAEGEAAVLVGALRETFAGGLSAPLGVVMPAFLGGRDREIWSPFFSLAEAFGFDGRMMDRLTRAAADLTSAKTAPARRHVDMGLSESDAVDNSYGQRALQDLRSVLREGETGIWTAVAIERMLALPVGPWRTFRGVGLDAISLANLLNRFGVHHAQIASPRAAGGKRVNRQGYTRKSIEASCVGKGGRS